MDFIHHLERDFTKKNWCVRFFSHWRMCSFEKLTSLNVKLTHLPPASRIISQESCATLTWDSKSIKFHPTLRINWPSYGGVWPCIEGFWDLQTTSFEIPWLGNLDFTETARNFFPSKTTKNWDFLGRNFWSQKNLTRGIAKFGLQNFFFRHLGPTTWQHSWNITPEQNFTSTNSALRCTNTATPCPWEN